jgi:hypothetical protein
VSTSWSREATPRVRAADSKCACFGEFQADVTAGNEALELGRGAFGDQLPAVEDAIRSASSSAPPGTALSGRW